MSAGVVFSYTDFDHDTLTIGEVSEAGVSFHVCSAGESETASTVLPLAQVVVLRDLLGTYPVEGGFLGTAQVPEEFDFAHMLVTSRWKMDDGGAYFTVLQYSPFGVGSVAVPGPGMTDLVSVLSGIIEAQQGVSA